MRTQSPGTHQRIFDAAARLFADRRFHEVRMEDLAAEAGVSKGTLYRYFRTKEDLYEALIVTAAEQILHEVDSRTSGVDGPEAKLVEIANSLIGFFDDHPYFFDLLQHVEALSLQGHAFTWGRTRKDLLARVVALLEDERLLVRDPQQCGLMFLGSLRAVYRFGVRPRPVDLAQSVVATLLYGATGSR